MATEQENKKFRDPMKGRNLLNTFHAELVEAIETGKPLSWQEDWKGEAPPLPYNGASKNTYTGINIFLLEKDKENKSDPRYYTFKQVAGMPGIKVSKGAKASKIIFYDMDNQFQFPQRDRLTKEIVMNNKGEPIMVKMPIIDVYNVFNDSQLVGLSPHKNIEPAKQRTERISRLAGAVLGEERNAQLRASKTDDLSYSSVACVEISEKSLSDLLQHAKPAERALRVQVATYLLCREYGVAAPLRDIYKDQTEKFRKEWAALLKADRKAFTKAARDASKAIHKVLEIERTNDMGQPEQTQEKTKCVQQQLYPKTEHIKQEAPSIPAADVSAADIDAAKVVAQNIIYNEALMKDDMVNEGHEKTAVDAAIQSKQFLNDRPRQETYATELTRIRKESGKDVKIIEGRINKYYGPGKLKLYEKTAVLSLSRNLKVAYDIKDLNGQMPEALEKEVPIRGMKLYVGRIGNKESRGIHITPAKENTAELER